jgi:dUTP pyrophosphatase
MSVLSREEIKDLLDSNPPLIEHFVNIDDQLQPNGFDLTLKSVSIFQTHGQITRRNASRQVSAKSNLIFDGLGYVHLPPGIYSITYNEVVNIPSHLIAIAAPRSSLLRCGVSINTAIWDAGYSGRSESLLIVFHQQGFKVQKDARILQLVFLQLNKQTVHYSGSYQGENITKQQP